MLVQTTGKRARVINGYHDVMFMIFLYISIWRLVCYTCRRLGNKIYCVENSLFRDNRLFMLCS